MIDKHAADVLLNDESSATVIFETAKRVLGASFVAWEPESIWLELKDEGIDLSPINRDKLMATLTLIQTGSFYWDAAVFENTIMAFEHQYSSPEVLQEASPAQIAWGISEAEIILERNDKEKGVFDHEPTQYTAVSLHRAGLVVAPDLLEFAQEELDKLNRGNLDIKEEVQKRWKALDKTRLDQLELSETPVDVQIGYLAAVYIHVAERAKQLKDELAQMPTRLSRPEHA